VGATLGLSETRRAHELLDEGVKGRILVDPSR
jgi:hypothetical protein